MIQTALLFVAFDQSSSLDAKVVVPIIITIIILIILAAGTLLCYRFRKKLQGVSLNYRKQSL